MIIFHFGNNAIPCWAQVAMILFSLAAQGLSWQRLARLFGTDVQPDGDAEAAPAVQRGAFSSTARFHDSHFYKAVMLAYGGVACVCVFMYSLHQIQRILRQRKTSLKRRTAIVHDLPVVIYRHRHELERLSEADLREELLNAGVSTEGCKAKEDLVNAAVDAGGSSGTACSICYDDYCTHDVVRVLPCGHRFHADCVDEWLLGKPRPGSTRRFVCPLCSASLDDR